MFIDSVVEEAAKRIKLVVFDFDGVFTDNCVYVSQDGTESVSCWRSDGLGLEKLKRFGFPLWVISTETNPVVGVRCKKIKINFMQGCDNKLFALDELIERYSCMREDVVFVGNDINDIDCLKVVGFPIVVADAHPEVFEFSKYTTKNAGGRGAVREVCDLISFVHNGGKHN
jgi:3-deoxy-D-manno-octulosonate 8-phosphate phosphatase (KDO 8-P phosphatase)